MLLVSVSLGHIDSELYTVKQFASATFSLFGRFCDWRTTFILNLMLAKLLVSYIGHCARYCQRHIRFQFFELYTVQVLNFHIILFVCLFGLRLYVPVNNFSVMSG